MKTYSVLSKMRIGSNTAIVVDCPGDPFRNGIYIKGDNDCTY